MDRFSRRGRWLQVLLGLALALAVMLVLVRVISPPARPSLAVELEVRPGGRAPGRVVEATVGDQVAVHATGADAVWTYRDGGGLIARCPGATVPTIQCRTTARGVEVEVAVHEPGRYRFVAIRGRTAVEPTGDLDRDTLTLRAAGARLELRTAVAPR